MKFTENIPPRTFEVGGARRFLMADCGTLELDADEQITLVTESGAEYDVARKDWGFYATPSLNGRLESFGLRGADFCGVAARDPIRIETVEIAAGRQYLRRARQIAAGHRADIAAVQRVYECRKLAVFREFSIDGLERRNDLGVDVGQSVVRAVFVDNRFDGSVGQSLRPR